MISPATSSGGLRNPLRNGAVSFALQPGAADVRGRMVWVTFCLELSGRHDSCGTDKATACPACSEVLVTLFEVADALWPLDREAFAQTGHDCEKRVRYVPAESEHEVAVGWEIMVGRPFARATDGWALDFMEHISASLT